MDSRNRLITCVLLVAGYIGVHFYEKTVMHDHLNLKKIVNDNFKDSKIYLDGLNHQMKSFIAIYDIENSHAARLYKEGVMVLEICNSTELQKSMAGTALINREIGQRDLPLSLVDKTKLVSSIIDKSQNYIDKIQSETYNLKLMLNDKQETYRVGREYSLDFKFVEMLQPNEMSKYSYMKGDSEIEINEFPLVLKELPDSLHFKMKISNYYTGERNSIIRSYSTKDLGV